MTRGLLLTGACLALTSTVVVAAQRAQTQARGIEIVPVSALAHDPQMRRGGDGQELGQALHEARPVLSPDGALIATAWHAQEGRGSARDCLVVIDVADGEVEQP